MALAEGSCVLHRSLASQGVLVQLRLQHRAMLRGKRETRSVQALRAGMAVIAAAQLQLACAAADASELPRSETVDAIDGVPRELPPLPELLEANQARIDAIVERFGQAQDNRASVEAQQETEAGALARGSDTGRVLADGDAELVLQVAAPRGDRHKGKVLAETVIGREPIAPVAYAWASGDTLSFQRPDLEANVILIPDAAPAFVFEDFVIAVASIANATPSDCLEQTFMTVMRQAVYDGLAHHGRSALRTKTVVYGAAACSGGYAACAQYPLVDAVLISSPEDGAEERIEERFVTGRRIAVDSEQIASSSTLSRAVFMHELMHTLGVAHPKRESLTPGVAVGKLVVPGTLAGSCVSRRCAEGDSYPSLMHQSLDAGRAHSLQPDDIDVLGTLYSSALGCDYSRLPLELEAR